MSDLADIYSCMGALTAIFWIAFSLVFYCYFGYALCIMLFRMSKRPVVTKRTGVFPSVSLIIASHNEATVLAKKIENSLSLDYPPDLLEIIIADDGSDDGSAGIIARYPSVKHCLLPRRSGKVAALNAGVREASSEIVVLTDANSFMNRESLKRLIPHFTDPVIGAVAGEKKISHHAAVGTAEGWYWEYESFMKKLDSDFHTVLSGTGELFALRRSLYVPPDEDIILDDFILSMHICRSGYRIAYEPGAYTVEAPAPSLAEEAGRKTRIAAGAFQALQRLRFSPGHYQSAFLFQFYSRRWLRWVLCPWLVFALLPLNALLSIFHPSPFYDYIFGAHIFFYALAVLGWLSLKSNKAFMLTTIPFYFLFMHLCMVRGLFRFLQKKHTVLWTKAGRVAV